VGGDTDYLHVLLGVDLARGEKGPYRRCFVHRTRGEMRRPKGI